MSSTVAMLFEHSSRETPAGKADPYLLLLRTMDVQTSDVAHVVRRLGDIRTSALHIDDKLVPYLKDDSKTFIEALTSLTSVGGKGLKYLTTQTQAYHITEKSAPQKKMSMRELIEGQHQQKPQNGEYIVEQ